VFKAFEVHRTLEKPAINEYLYTWQGAFLIDRKSHTPHEYRRAFALSMLRQGVDVFTLAKLMGHEGIDVLKHYLKQPTQHTENAHHWADPVVMLIYAD